MTDPRGYREIDPTLLRLHPLAGLVPPMRKSEWQEFYSDVARSRRIRVPLELLPDERTVIDGKHRLKAALALKMPLVPFVDAPLNGDSPEVYMMKAAVLRRHLTDSQRAAMAVLWKEESKKEHGEGQPKDNTGRFAERPAERIDTRTKATAKFNVSRWKVDQATKVHNANPELFEKVHKGGIALSNAYRQVHGVEEKQKIASTTPPQGTYQVIVIDPPWPFNSRQKDPTHEIASLYEPMSIEKIKAADAIG